jgi:hypothetical protein
VFGNRVLKGIFGPKWEEVAGRWRRLHNEKLHNLYASPNIILTKHHAMKAYWGSGCIAPLIL